MSDISESTLARARAAVGKLKGITFEPEFLETLTAEEALDLLTEQVETALQDAELAQEVLEAQAREIEALRTNVRAYAAGVGELRITNAMLTGRVKTVTIEVQP